MALYRIYVYLHILGAFGVFAALAVEALSLGLLGRAVDAAQQRQALALMRVNRALGPLSLLLLLVPGLYMAFAVWSSGPPWVAVSFAGFVLVVALGAAVTGKQLAKLERALQGSASAPQPLALAALRSSLGTRLGLLLGVTFAMVVKPELAGSLIASGLGLFSGLLGAQWLGRPPRALRAAAEGG